MAKPRKDVNALKADDLANYIHALDVLRERSRQNPDDESGYAFQAALHNDPFVGPCEHGSDGFLAWHRAHLHYFEALLQASDPPRTADVTIPYWDWLHAEPAGRKFPAAFSEAGLFTPGRNPNPTPLPPDTLDIVTGERNWNEFGGYPPAHPGRDYGRLELGPHNYMHPDFIGGMMADPSTAAEDPIYFSFHAFIDLLWSEWQRRNGSPPPTSPDTELQGFAGKPRHIIGDFQRPADLGYEYEYSDRLRDAFGIAHAAPRRGALLASAPLRPLFEGSVRSAFEASARAQFAFPPSPPGAVSTLVRLRDLAIPMAGSFLIRAYVHPRSTAFAPDDADFGRRYGVGYVAVWRRHGEGHGGGHHHGRGADAPRHHHPTACTARFDITKALSDAGPERVGDLRLTLYYVPSPGPGGEPAPVPSLVKEVDVKDVLLEAYAQS